MARRTQSQPGTGRTGERDPRERGPGELGLGERGGGEHGPGERGPMSGRPAEAGTLALQRAIGNRATARLLSRWSAHPDKDKKGVLMPDAMAAEYSRLNPPLSK